MTEHLPPLHGSFTLTRNLPAPVASVFSAFSQLSLRRQWFRLPGPRGSGTHDLDFREGGHETLRGTFTATGVPEVLANTGTFLEIVPDRRIVRAYEVTVDGVRRWASLVTQSFAPDGSGSRLTHTEEYVFLAYQGDGADDVAHLAGGTSLQLNGLANVLAAADR